jgi:hypothetical protein
MRQGRRKAILRMVDPDEVIHRTLPDMTAFPPDYCG